MARVLDQTSVNPAFLAPINTLGGSAPVLPRVDMEVQKIGRETDHTIGIVIDTAAIINVRFPHGSSRIFEDQVLIQGAPRAVKNKGLPARFAEEGDSGAVVVEHGAGNHPVALLFAGSTGGIGAANALTEVLARLKLVAQKEMTIVC